MMDFWNTLLNLLPEITIVVSGVVTFIKLVGSLKNNLGNLQKDLNTKLKSNAASIESLIAGQKTMEMENLALRAELSELKAQLKDVADLKKMLIDLNIDVRKLAVAVKNSVDAEIVKQKDTIAALERDKRRLGGG